jgi:hypothetical protein
VTARQTVAAHRAHHVEDSVVAQIAIEEIILEVLLYSRRRGFVNRAVEIKRAPTKPHWEHFAAAISLGLARFRGIKPEGFDSDAPVRSVLRLYGFRVREINENIRTRWQA